MKGSWFILIENKQEGPYTILQLKEHSLFTPDTLVWTQGMETWLPAGQVKALDEVFEDPEESKPLEDLYEKPSFLEEPLPEEDILTFEPNNNSWILWLILAILLLMYLLSL